MVDEAERPNDISSLIEDLAVANSDMINAEEQVLVAQSVATKARIRVNDLQFKIDCIIAGLRSNAPRGSTWKRESP